MFLAKKGSRIGKAITVQYQRKVYKAPTRHNDKIRGGKTKKQIRTGSTKEDIIYAVRTGHPERILFSITTEALSGP